MICSVIVNARLKPGDTPYEPAHFFPNLPRMEVSPEARAAQLMDWVESTRAA